MNDSIEIFLKDVVVPVRIGFYDSEKHTPQTLRLSVKLWLTPLPDYRAIGDDLGKLLDYYKLYRFLTVTIPQQPHRLFLETLAEDILQFCWQDARVERARVRVQKPEALAGVQNVGVILERQRPSA